MGQEMKNLTENAKIGKKKLIERQKSDIVTSWADGEKFDGKCKKLGKCDRWQKIDRKCKKWQKWDRWQKI